MKVSVCKRLCEESVCKSVCVSKRLCVKGSKSLCEESVCKTFVCKSVRV